MKCPRCGKKLQKTHVAKNTVRWECPDEDCCPRSRTIIGGILRGVFD